MAIKKSILVKNKGDNGVEYIYPKTSADNVQYENNITVKEKIDSLITMLGELKNATVESLYESVNLNVSMEYYMNMDIFNRISLECYLSDYTTFTVSLDTKDFTS